MTAMYCEISGTLEVIPPDDMDSDAPVLALRADADVAPASRHV
jgi:hypothetical protein